MKNSMQNMLLTILFNSWLKLLREKKYDELKADLETGLKALDEDEEENGD